MNQVQINYIEAKANYAAVNSQFTRENRSARWENKQWNEANEAMSVAAKELIDWGCKVLDNLDGHTGTEIKEEISKWVSYRQISNFIDIILRVDA